MRIFSLIQRLIFRLRCKFTLVSFARKAYWSLQGASFGHGTKVPRLHCTWPHQIEVGDKCTLEDDIYFKFDGVWQPGPSIKIADDVFVGRGCEFNVRQSINIADHCLIASGCKFVDHDHAIARDLLMNMPGLEAPIILEENVWLGANVVVLRGVVIGKGAIVGAGAVVTKCIPDYEIWAGVPARKIGERKISGAVRNEHNVVAANEFDKSGI